MTDPITNRAMAGGGHAWYPNAPIGDVRVNHTGRTPTVMCFGHDIQGNPIRLSMTQDQARKLGTALTEAAQHTRRPTW